MKLPSLVAKSMEKNTFPPSLAPPSLQRLVGPAQGRAAAALQRQQHQLRVAAQRERGELEGLNQRSVWLYIYI